MTENDSIFVKCDCGGCSVLEIKHNEDETFDVALWEHHNGTNKLSKSERIRWCEHVMKTGNPWADHTIVNHTDAKRIATYITEKLKLTQYGKQKRK